MKTHAQVIAGSDTANLALKCAVSIHTVRSWGQRSSIPPEHWPTIIEAGAASLEELAAGVKPRKRRDDVEQAAAA